MEPDLKSYFTAHPASVGESYLEHMRMAFTFAIQLAIASFCCLVHGLLPFLFVKSGSARIRDLHARLVTHRHAGTASAKTAIAEDEMEPSGDETPGQAYAHR